MSFYKRKFRQKTFKKAHKTLLIIISIKKQKFAKKYAGTFLSNTKYSTKIRSTLEIAALDLTVYIFGPKELEILIFTLDLAVLSK